jgi:hypothetical protein
MPITVNGLPVIHELHAPLRFSAPRSLLETINPDPDAKVERQELLVLETWLSSRYRRRVFPDTLDQRISEPNHKRFRKLVKPIEHHIEVILYSLDTYEELANPAEKYALTIILLINAGAAGDADVLDALDKAVDKMQEMFDGVEGLDCAVMYESVDDMTFSRAVQFNNWGFEDLSIEAGVGE